MMSDGIKEEDKNLSLSHWFGNLKINLWLKLHKFHSIKLDEAATYYDKK